MVILIILSLLLVISPLSASADEKVDYDSIVRNNSKKSLAELNKLGYERLEYNEYDKALAYYTLAISKHNGIFDGNDMREYIKALNNIGYIFLFGRSNPEKAYPYLLRARSLAEKAGEDDLLAAILDNIAKVHDDFGDSDKAIDLYNLAMTYAAKSDTGVSHVIQLMVLNDMVNCAMVHNVVDKIGPSLDKFNSLPEYSIPMGKYSKMMCRALQLLLKGEINEATSVIKGAEKFIDGRMDSARYVTDHRLNMANLYHIRGMDDSARIYLDKALRNSVDHNLPDRLPRIYRGMAMVEDACGDSVESKRMKLLAYEANEKLHSSKMYAYLNTLDATRQIDDLNVKLTEADIRHSHRVTVIWILVVAIAIIVSLLVYIFIRNRRLSASLRELVSRHQASISAEEANTRLRHEYENTISALQKELEKCSIAEDTLGSLPGQGDTESDQAEQKRLVLPVDDKERLRIIGVVNDIFDRSAEIYDPNFSLELLSELAGTKSRYLSALLNDTFGKSFSVLLAEARVRKACSLLLSPEFRKTKTIESIATEVGYRSRTSFTYVFKKITGVTPLQYVSNAT